MCGQSSQLQRWNGGRTMSEAMICVCGSGRWSAGEDGKCNDCRPDACRVGTTVHDAVSGLVNHELTEVTEGGNFLTKCQNLILVGRGKLIENNLITCQACLKPEEPEPLPPPPRVAQSAHARRKSGRPTGRPQWRPERNQNKEDRDRLRYAMTAIVAATEWYNRGGEGQFAKEMLDQAHLGYRFLAELLAHHGMIDPPETLDVD